MGNNHVNDSEQPKSIQTALQRVHLEIFEALQRTGSLTKAADELCLTQSALTHSVKKLESMSGVQLWQREGRNLRLTQAGEYLLTAARRILPQLREVESMLHSFGAGIQGRLRIGVECHPCYEYLVGIIEAFLRRWRNVDIDVTRQFQFEGISALRNHEVDLLVSPDIFNYDDLLYQEILDFELQLLVSSDHRLAGRAYAAPSDLIEETLYSYPVGKERLDVFTRFLLPARVEPKKLVQVEATEIMMQLVAAERGVSTFPDWLIAKYKNEFSITGVPLGPDGIKKKLFVVIRKQDESIPYLKDFVAISRSQSDHQ